MFVKLHTVLFVNQSVILFIYMLISLFGCQSLCLPVSRSVRLSVFPFIYMFISMFGCQHCQALLWVVVFPYQFTSCQSAGMINCLSVDLSTIHQSICPPLCLSVICQHICLIVYLAIYSYVSPLSMKINY